MRQTICDAMSLGDWFSGSSRKGGTGGGELGIYTPRVKTAWLHLDLAVKNSSVDHFSYFKCKWSCQFTSVFKSDLLARAG